MNLMVIEGAGGQLGELVAITTSNTTTITIITTNIYNSNDKATTTTQTYVSAVVHDRGVAVVNLVDIQVVGRQLGELAALTTIIITTTTTTVTTRPQQPPRLTFLP